LEGGKFTGSGSIEAEHVIARDVMVEEVQDVDRRRRRGRKE